MAVLDTPHSRPHLRWNLINLISEGWCLKPYLLLNMYLACTSSTWGPRAGCQDGDRHVRQGPCHPGPGCLAQCREETPSFLPSPTRCQEPMSHHTLNSSSRYTPPLPQTSNVETLKTTELKPRFQKTEFFIPGLTDLILSNFLKGDLPREMGDLAPHPELHAPNHLHIRKQGSAQTLMQVQRTRSWLVKGSHQLHLEQRNIKKPKET